MGPGAKQRQEKELGRLIIPAAAGQYPTAVLSIKGGIGKTSTTVGVGLTLAEYRGDAPCAIDTNPDSGDLVERALGEGFYQQSRPHTITDLLRNIDSIDSLTGRPHCGGVFADPQALRCLLLPRLTDCGTGVTHNALSGILHVIWSCWTCLSP